MERYDPNQYDSIFNEWAHAYDQTVNSQEGEYHEVFACYGKILKTVTDLISRPAGSLIVDLGTGTGNLAAMASEKGYRVLGIDPNQAMLKIAAEKFPELLFDTGDFLNLPHLPGKCEAIISSYAFHHLTDDEKARSAVLMNRVLPHQGRIIFADTMFSSKIAQQDIVRDAEDKGYRELVKDLNREHYTTQKVMRSIFVKAGFKVTFTQMNLFVWVMLAVKQRSVLTQ